MCSGSSRPRPLCSNDRLFFRHHVSLVPETINREKMTTTTLHQAQRTGFDPKVTAHFHASAELYKLWSPEGHIHFGYWNRSLNPLHRKPLLEALVHHAARELKPAADKRIADLGCGYGTAARLIARTYGARVEALTVVEEQMQEGAIASLLDNTFDKVTMRLRDFRDTGLRTASMDGAYALESLCYGTGYG